MRSARKPLAAAFVLTISTAAVGAGGVACGLEQGAPLYGTDGGPNPQPSGTTSSSGGTSGTTNPPPPICPENDPGSGTFCSQEGTQCSYGGICLGSTYVCSGGVWLATKAGDPEPLACPAEQPSPGDSCGACASLYPAECTYSDDSGCVQSKAFCDPGSLTWQVSVAACNPPAVDAGSGGGP